MTQESWCEMLVENDPVLAVRKAVIDGMCRCGMQPEKELVDAVADALPDFFRQPLQPVERASVVDVPSHEMNFQQSSDLATMMESMSGREELLAWLKANDLMVHKAFTIANDFCGSHGDHNRAVVIMLADALRGKRTDKNEPISLHPPQV